jgi:hypothetical protein
MVDLSVFGKFNSKQDFDRAEEEFQLRKQAAQADIMKAQQLDAGKLGENAFLKAAQGLELSPQELAAAQLMDAKSGGIQFDPVTGGMISKPRISDKIGLPGMTPSAMPPKMDNFSLPPLPGGNGVPSGNEYDGAFAEQMSAAAGNPKLQQQLREQYAKDQIQFDDTQAKAAGFADRMAQSNPIFEDEKIVEAGSDLVQRGISKIPVVGNALVRDEFQQFDQAQRDFINAQLRRESGAVISPQEFQNARQQYFPQPGDSAPVLAQKKANRAAAEQGMQRSAGPGYKPKTKYEQAEAEFNGRKSDPLGIRQ